MRILCLQHVPFEDCAHVGQWAKDRGHPITTVRLHEGESLPDWRPYHLFLILGGPMNVDEEAKYPWLAAEKRYIRECLDHHKKVLGLCLGAQLMARALGADVRPNAQKEIGWHRVEMLEPARTVPLLQDWPQYFVPFHWHGDTFDIPEGAKLIARSEACENQGFAYGDRALALQFHLEYTDQSIHKMLEADDAEVKAGGDFVQSEREMLDGTHNVDEANYLMRQMLHQFETMED